MVWNSLLSAILCQKLVENLKEGKIVSLEQSIQNTMHMVVRDEPSIERRGGRNSRFQSLKKLCVAPPSHPGRTGNALLPCLSWENVHPLFDLGWDRFCQNVPAKC
jgi:hypothetical protein